MQEELEYKRVNWKNAPSKQTPINDINLNNMDKGIANAVSKIKEIKEKTDEIINIDNSTNPTNYIYNFTMGRKGSMLVICNNNVALLYYGIKNDLRRNVLYENGVIKGTVTAIDNNNGILSITIPPWGIAKMIFVD